jgi:hypothetical protein
LSSLAAPSTSTLRFEFSRQSDGEVTGFDLGDLTVIGDDCAVWSSSGKSPSQSMMIYISLVGLLDGITQLCGAGTRSHRSGGK